MPGHDVLAARDATAQTRGRQETEINQTGAPAKKGRGDPVELQNRSGHASSRASQQISESCMVASAHRDSVSRSEVHDKIALRTCPDTLHKLQIHIPERCTRKNIRGSSFCSKLIIVPRSMWVS